MKPKRPYLLALAAMILFVGCPQQSGSEPEFPARPIKLIVPFNAGGSSDTFARTIQKAITDHKLLPEPIVIVNRGGAGGTIGSRYFKHRRADGYTLMLLHQAVLTAKLAGKVDYGPEAFEPIAGTSEESAVIAVSSSSDYDTLAKLLAEAKASPDSVKFAVNFGAPSHFLAQQIESESDGAVFRYVQSGGGSDRFAAIAGGHVDATIFSVGEYLQFQSAGLRALVVFDAERNSAIADVPTAREESINVVNTNMQYWWAPRGTPPERLVVIEQALAKAMQTAQVREALATIQAEPTFLTGDQISQRLAKAEAEMSMNSAKSPTHLAWLPAILFGSAVVLGSFVVIGRIRKPNTSTAATPNGRAFMFGLVTVVYVLALSFELVDFRIATLAFMVAAGVVMVGRQGKAVAGFAAVSVVVAFGVHYIMAGLMGVDLP